MLASKLLSAAGGTETLWVDDVFQTTLYTGNGSTQTINNGIQLGDVYSGTTLKIPFDTNTTDVSNSFSATATGTAAFASGAGKFGAGAAGGFNGSSWLDYSSQAGDFGSGDWTVEFWLKTTSGDNPGIVCQATGGGAASTSWGFFVGYGTSGNCALYLSNGSSYFASISGSTIINNNVYHHIAASRSGSTVRLFVDGVLQGSASVGTTALGNGGLPVRIGAQGTSYALPNGNIDDVRIVKGVAVYTTGFTPPTSATSHTEYPATIILGKGGLVWIKQRTSANNILFDTERGAGKRLSSDLTAAQATNADTLTVFNNNGFSLGADAATFCVNYNGNPYTSWTFRKAPKFFDCGTYTGNGVAGRQIPHSLGVAPGMVIVKRTDSTSNWSVGYIRNTSLWTGVSFTGMYLNTTSAVGGSVVNGHGITAVSETAFTITAIDASNGLEFNPNTNGASYVWYAFAHDSSTDGIIQCGSFTTDGSGNATVNLGWEPQYVMRKRTSGTSNWEIFDVMRGWTNPDTSGDARLAANDSAAEVTGTAAGYPTATGFYVTEPFGSSTYIYLAIRRPNKPPTTGTQVYKSVAYTGNATTRNIDTSPVTPDFVIVKPRGTNGTANSNYTSTRLAGSQQYMATDSTGAEASGGGGWIDMDVMNAFEIGGSSGGGNSNGVNFIAHAFRRAPGVFSICAYTGTGSATTVSHDLGVAPELMVVKVRSTTNWWVVGFQFGASTYSYALLNESAAGTTGATYAGNVYFNAQPSLSNFTVSDHPRVNASSATYIAYLWATKPGISKVTSVTKSSGSSLNVDCGFSAGARFVMLKRTDSTGDWYVWDSVRGIVSANDPFLLLNSTAAENTSTDYIDPYSAGFTIVDGGLANGTYLVLAYA